MKVDRESDMRYCLAQGVVTNLPSCNDRINAVWRERNGQRVFMMFSISGQKEFCAMGEMLGPVSRGSMPGWSKPGCQGFVLQSLDLRIPADPRHSIVFVTFIFVKNVPFPLINHIKHKSNGQPVANMWHSMMYHDNTGYHVARIYCEHPVLSSVLVKIHTETQVNYKSQMRIPASGGTAYSASSFSSTNDKSYDPRSATKVTLHRSGNRTQRNRYANQSHWRRPDGIPPTPSRPAGRFIKASTSATPTSAVSQHRDMIQFDMARAAQSPTPPPFKLSEDAGKPASGDVYSSRSFTTADDRMLADFASSRDAKRSDVNRTPNSFQQAEVTAHDPFRVGRNPRDGQHYTPLPNNTKWHGAGQDARNGRYQSSPYDVQWQGDGRAAQVPVFLDKSFAGLGIGSAVNRPYNGQGQDPIYTNGKALHLPSPDTSSQSSHQGSSSHSNQMRRQKSQGFALPSPPSLSAMRSARGHGHPFPQPQSRSRVVQDAAIPPSGDQKDVAKPSSSVRHSQSMPFMVTRLSHQLSANNLRDHNDDTKTHDVNNVVASSPTVQDWVVTTPTRPTTAATEQTPRKALNLKTTTDPDESPEKPVRSADMADRLKWHKAMAVALEVEVKMAQANGQSSTEKQDLVKWHNAKVACLEVEIIAARKNNEDARGGLAQGTANHRPASPSTPQNSADYNGWVHSSSIESDKVAPESDENGKILRSVSKNREGKAIHIGQKLRHRRGDVSNGGFTSSFDARASANVENLISSPARVSATPADQMTYTHGHPKQYASMRPTHAQHDSCTEYQDSTGDERYSYMYDDQTSDFASQIGPLEEDDEVFSPRGRSYYHPQAIRDVSQMSQSGGIQLAGGHEHK